MIELGWYVAAIAAILIAAVFAYWKNPIGVGPSLPPGPIGVPVLGYSPFLDKTPWTSFEKLKQKYGNIVSLYMGQQLTVVLQDYETIKEAFVGDEDNFTGRPQDCVAKYISTGKDGNVHGIIQLEGEKWQNQSNYIKQGLLDLGVNTPKIDRVIQEEIRHLIDALISENGKPFYAYDIVHRCMASIVGLVAFGHRFDYKGEEFTRVIGRIHEMYELLAGSPVQAFPILRHVPPFKNLWEGLEYSVAQQQEMLTKEMAKHKAEHAADPGKKANDFFDLYLDNIAGAPVKAPGLETEDDIFTMASTMWSAGPEATTVAIQWALLHLLRNPKVQAKVHEELDRVIGKENMISISDKDNLPYTTATFYEFLRLGGNNPMGVPRSTKHATIIGGYTIPKRTLIFPNIWSAHRDPKYWTDPLTFQPERFLVNDSSNGPVVKVPEHFIIFSIGKRECPGQQLARMQIFLVFANLMQKFNFGAEDEKSLPSILDSIPGVSAETLPFKVIATRRF